MSKTKIPTPIKMELWRRSAGRCEFKGCNKPLYTHDITKDCCNISQLAHIRGDSPNGPRGNKDSEKFAKDINNIMLLCPECHRLIDHEGEDKYDEDTLFAMKKEHEERMEFLTGLKEDLQAHIVTYGANIAEHRHEFSFEQLKDALLPDYYPTSTNPIELGVDFYNGQNWENYWKREEENLVFKCKENILRPLDRWEYKRIALFALAPMPLLVRLGTLLNNKHEVVIFQKQRRGGWKWPEESSNVSFIVNRPANTDGKPVLVLSLSFPIMERVKRERPNESIWEITIAEPNPDFMQSKDLVYKFGRTVENVIDEISKASPQQSIDLYISAPVSCAVEFGRVWMQKANPEINIYDYDRRFSQEDKLAITIKQ